MTDQPELHDLTKFILSRLESYPEEFFYDLTGLESKKWAKSLLAIKHCGTAEDKAAINKAYMDLTLQNALKTLLAPEESADNIAGQSFSVTPVGIPSGYDGVQGSIGVGGGPSLAKQQAQAIMNAQQAQAIMNAQRAQQSMRANSVTLHPSAGLKPPTAKETLAEAYEQIKKRLGL